MSEDTLKKINDLHERITKLKYTINSCKNLKELRNIQWIMTSDTRRYNNLDPYIDIVLTIDEMRMMDSFLDKLIFKKEKELAVLEEQFSKY